MKKQSFIIIIFVLLLSFPKLNAQNETSQKPSSFGKLQGPVLVPSIAQQIKDGTFIGVTPKQAPKEAPPKRRGANKNIPGKGFPKNGDALVQNQKAANRTPGREPSLVFDAAVSNYSVSDATGAVGPNHFVGAWNTSFRIFDKDGNPLTDEASLGTLFPGNTIGDPIVFYDAEADRFVITEFDDNPNGFNMAVCQGSDPVNDGWYIYTTSFATGSFPDYTKFAVWSDGYYVTANIGATDKVFAVEREEMLLGNEAQFVGFPLTGITTSGFYSPQFFHVTDDNLPATGNATVVYLQDDAWSGVESDHLKIWTVDVDWETIDNSSISAPTELSTTPFTSVFDGGSFSNVPQLSGPDQDVLQATIMNQAQFRKFSDHNSAIFDFVVDTDGSGDELAGIRWFELRQDSDGDPWTIYQEGTYISPYEDKHAFSGSMVMDGMGNIGMGYTTCSENHRIAINYTGRFANDPLGQMTVDETLIAQSTSNNPGNRLADYVQLSLDPSNDKTFWHIAEYFVNNQRTDVVGVFQIASDFANDVGVLSIDEPIDGELSETDTIKITVFNYGTNDQSDIPVNYQVDGGDIVSEIMEETLPSGASAQYVFTTTANLGNIGQTYQITAFTSLESDENNANDTVVKDVHYLFPNDIGVTAFTSPVSGSGLSDAEEITVKIENFGTADQHDFDVSYKLDGDIVTEQVPDTVKWNNSISYTFAQTGDFSALGTYNLSAYTSLFEDTDNTNDTTLTEIENSFCQPNANCSDGDGFYLFQIGSIDNTTDCSTNGYGDYTALSTELANNSTNDLTLTTHYGNQNVKVWIDFNDNFVFEDNEVVVENTVIAPGQSSGEYTEVLELIIPDGVNLGQHLMRAKSNYNSPVPDDACEGTEYGETEDYTAELVLFIGVEDVPLANSDMVIRSFDNNQFEISLATEETTETLIINLHNILGQKLVENRVENINGRYVYKLDLSYAKPGAYIIRLGNAQYGKVKRIMVK
jgi:hypothetical protein